jgi:hypothetical protein
MDGLTNIGALPSVDGFASMKGPVSINDYVSVLLLLSSTYHLILRSFAISGHLEAFVLSLPYFLEAWQHVLRLYRHPYYNKPCLRHQNPS